MNELSDIRYATDAGIAEVTLDRPESRNAIRPQTLRDLDAARKAAEDEDEVGALLIAAPGEAVFCAGADLGAVSEITDDQEALEGFLRLWHRVYDGLDDATVPVVASVDGQALAGGLELVAACDLVVAGTEAAFGDQHVNVNLIPGGGNTQRLPRLIGRRRAKELMFTGDTIDARTAREWGLVNRVADGPESLVAGRDLAEQIASKREEAVRRMKELTNEGIEIPLSQALSLERQAAALHIPSDAAREGLDRFLG